ncbi:MAG: riboflavin synthase [Ktedonobacterales bacterium]|nr:riboflavin synthase [Ktedonobacterales bacterium]
MFTGIVEEMGTLTASVEHDGRRELTFAATVALVGTRLGDSIAVNGVCLTAIDLTPTTFTIEIQPETQRRTNLGDLHPGDRVNLERPLAADGRFGGHIVQGHIDGTGTLRALTPDGPAIVATIAVAPDLLRYIVPQGFIAVDGTSLTVVNVDRSTATFTVALITHTQAAITLPTLAVGNRVNIEVDIISKYVESLVGQK